MLGQLARRLRRLLLFPLAGAWALGAAFAAHASVEPLANVVGREISLAGFVTDAGVVLDASSVPAALAASPGPWILAPIYARCPRTCSPLAENLRRAVEPLNARGVRPLVVLLSIDPEESEQRLGEFRQRLALPRDWVLVRARDRALLDSLLRKLAFVPVPLADGEIDHPNVVYVLSGKSQVVAVLPGLAPRTKDLAAALEQAEEGPPVRSPVLPLAVVILSSALLTVVLVQAFRSYARWQVSRAAD